MKYRQLTFFDDILPYDAMSLEEMRQHEWIVTWSGGKDSTATIILMHEQNIPIQEIIYVRMMYDDELPATLPVMTEFVDKAAEVFREWGYKVTFIKSLKTAKEFAEKRYFRSKYPALNGKQWGITAFVRAACNFTNCKIQTVESYMPKECYQMIGYARDEYRRFNNLGGKKQSILATMNIYEDEAFDICEKYGLLSPLYALGVKRDGCFFCPNSSPFEIELLKNQRPDLVEEIYRLVEMCDYPIMGLVKGGRQHWVKDYMEAKGLTEIQMGDMRVLEGKDEQ